MVGGLGGRRFGKPLRWPLAAYGHLLPSLLWARPDVIHADLTGNFCDMRPDDFFVYGTADPQSRRFDIDLITRLRRGPIAQAGDVEVAVGLARLVHEELEKFGTGGGEELTNVQMQEAILALRSIIPRINVGHFELPFRDLATFRNYWISQGAAGGGGYQKRRNLLAGFFESFHDRLADLENESLSSTLAAPISPHGRTGWISVDVEINELRRHFQSARTPQDYRAIGNDCVIVTEALSREVYKVDRHLRHGETEPPVANTKLRLDRFIDDATVGPSNAALRKLARSAIEMAQAVKHSQTPTRVEAGVAADAVILLSNILRRLDEPQIDG